MTYTEQDVRKAARRHAAAMNQLHMSVKAAAITAAKLAGMLEANADAPLEGGPLYHKADAAMGQLGDAYKAVAAIFDDLVDQ